MKHVILKILRFFACITTVGMAGNGHKLSKVFGFISGPAS